MALIRVKTHEVDVAELLAAVVARDSDAVAEVLDGALEFEGVIGGVVETLDGVVIDGLVEVLLDVLSLALEDPEALREMLEV